jgi:pimeloyl-ACP methyl ester carboxylesterase
VAAPRRDDDAVLPMIEGDVESRFVRRADVRLHYVVAGSGPTLILIHGLPDYWHGWHFQIAHLRNRYRLVAVDLRGVNLSDKPAGVSAYRIGELVRDTIALINELGLQRASIIGHDWGATIGWWTALLVPARVERLVALSAPHPARYVAAKENGQIHFPADYRAQVVDAVPDARFDPACVNEWAANPTVRAELTDALQRLDVESLRNFYRASDAVQSEQLAKLPPISIPVLTMYGAEDRFISPDAYAQSAQHVRGDFRAVAIQGAEHYPHKEATAQVNRELDRWLGTRRADAG